MEQYKLIIVTLFVVLVFAPVTWQAIRRRKLNPPPMARKDRKRKRLWRSHPLSYERQYGEMDRKNQQDQNEKNRITDQ